jgi:hypothetical protein
VNTKSEVILENAKYRLAWPYINVTLFNKRCRVLNFAIILKPNNVYLTNSVACFKNICSLVIVAYWLMQQFEFLSELGY